MSYLFASLPFFLGGKRRKRTQTKGNTSFSLEGAWEVVWGSRQDHGPHPCPTLFPQPWAAEASLQDAADTPTMGAGGREHPSPVGSRARPTCEFPGLVSRAGESKRAFQNRVCLNPEKARAL